VVVDPYTRYLISRDKVNQGAAVLLTSVGAARRLGVPADRWVFLHGHADLRERDLLERADLSASPAAVMAARHALDQAGIDAGALTAIDLYSCFPVPVFNVADGLGLAYDDPRGLTMTGGLPFFGGAGNNYSMHAIASVVEAVRSGGIGLVGANGGMMSKYSVGVYSATPAPWVPDESARLQAEIDSWDAPAEAEQADGWAVIESCTVKADRTGVVLGRLTDGRRFVARADDDAVARLESPQPIGERIAVRSTPMGNIAG
jgi:acetyl-CoA C-acetyltransferase